MGEKMNYSYLLLTMAILFEVCGTTCMKLSDGLSKMLPSILIAVFYIISFGLFTIALKKIDVGIAYATWSGIGTALIAAIGILYFREPLTAIKVFSLALIVVGVATLNLSGNSH